MDKKKIIWTTIFALAPIVVSVVLYLLWHLNPLASIILAAGAEYLIVTNKIK